MPDPEPSSSARDDGQPAPLPCGCEWVTKYCDEHHWEIRAKAKEQALARRLIEAIRRDGRDDVTWQRDHKQNHEDLVRIVATEDAYNAAIRTIETEVGL